MCAQHQSAAARRLMPLRNPPTSATWSMNARAPFESLSLDLAGQFGNLGVDVGRDIQDVTDRSGARDDLGHERDPHVHQRGRFGFGQHGLHCGPVGHRHRLVVTGDGPVPGEFEQRGFAADRAENGATADPGAFRDGRDGRRRVAALDEQLAGGRHDGSSGGPGLGLAQLGHIACGTPRPTRLTLLGRSLHSIS